MVMFASTKQGRFLKFESGALDANTLLVRTLAGSEAISRPYRFDLELVGTKTDIDSTAVLQASASLGVKQSVMLSATMKRGVRTLKIHGVLSEFNQRGLEGTAALYRAVLVPRLWRLSLTVHSRIFLEKTVPEIVEEILKENGFTKADYEFRTASRTYAKREYVVQYAETDLDFVSRIMEHEGIFYTFEQTEDADKVVFGDSSDDCKPIVGGDTVAYRAKSGGKAAEWLDAEGVRTFMLRHRPIPAKVILQDFNYRKPSVPLKVEAAVVPHGIGTYFEYGAHYKDETEGQWLADVRADEFRCREKEYVGTSDCRAFRAGQTFRLIDHFRDDFNRGYLVTEARHEATQDLDLGVAKVTGGYYGIEFVSIPSDVVYRPPRITAKPKIIGSINARIDGGGDGKYAEIDDEGRYKVKIPFDLTDRGKGQASRYMRMAQPYAGGGMGMHFPLHQGTEVILTHVNGDPDRPMIAAAVPNPESGSPVKGGNATQCAIQTGGGNKIVIEDSDGGQQIKLSSPTQNSYISLGAPNSPGHLTLGTAGNMVAQLGGDNIFKAAGHDLSEITGNQNSTVFGDTREMHFGALNRVVGKTYLDEASSGRFIVTLESVVDKTMKNRAVMTQNVHAVSCKQFVLKTDLDCVLRIGTTFLVHTSERLGMRAVKEMVLLCGDATKETWLPTLWKLEAKKIDLESKENMITVTSKTDFKAIAKTGLAELDAKTVTLTASEAINLTATGKPINVKFNNLDLDGTQVDLKAKTVATKDVEINAKLKVKGTNLVVE